MSTSLTALAVEERKPTALSLKLTNNSNLQDAKMRFLNCPNGQEGWDKIGFKGLNSVYKESF